MKRAWLVKSEPEGYAIDQLARDGKTRWTGVRNYLARNLMREMAVGDLVLFYHSNAEPSGIAGLARVSAIAAPDETQFDPKSDYFEPRASRAKPIWDCVELAFVAKAKTFVPLDVLRRVPELDGMELLRKGSRLSVQPVTPAHLAIVRKLAGLPAKA